MHRPFTRAVATALLFTLLGGCAGPRGAPPPSHATDPQARVAVVADAVLNDYFDQVPGTATLLRVPGISYDRLPDDSLAGVAARQARQDQWRAQLEQIDPRLLEGTPAGLSYAMARERLDSQAAARVCHVELWGVSQMLNGWQVRFTDLAQAQPVGTEELRRQALTRFGAVPAYADSQVANLRTGLVHHYTAAQVNVRAVIAQLDQMLATAPELSPFFSPAERDGDSVFRERFTVLVRDQINPALRRYREFLARSAALPVRGRRRQPTRDLPHPPVPPRAAEHRHR